MGVFQHWQGYRAFRKLPPASRHLVFYSESGQDWHHFAPILAELTGRHGLTLCYVTSDPDDPGLRQDNPRLLPFCVGAGAIRTLFFQFLQAGVMVMTMIDLHNLQLKRSVHPVHYVFMFHSLISTHMADFESSYDHYDTVLCAGPHQAREIRRREEMKQLPAKNLEEHGYGRLDDLLAHAAKRPSQRRAADEQPRVLLAPSWGDKTILNVCGDRLVSILLDAGLNVTLRPHYMTRRLTPRILDDIIDTHRGNPRFSVMEKMGDGETLFSSDVMITEWSGAGMDFALGLEKPVLYIDLPPKCRNDTWRELGIEPFESYVRDKIGTILSPDRLDDAPEAIASLLADPVKFRDRITGLRRDWVYNVGRSADSAAAIIARLAAEAVHRSREATAS